MVRARHAVLLRNEIPDPRCALRHDTPKTFIVYRRDPPKRIKVMVPGCVEGTARRAPTKRDSGFPSLGTPCPYETRFWIPESRRSGMTLIVWRRDKDKLRARHAVPLQNEILDAPPRRMPSGTPCPYETRFWMLRLGGCAPIRRAPAKQEPIGTQRVLTGVNNEEERVSSCSGFPG